MSVHPVRLLGDPILRASCEPITKPGSMAARVVVDDLKETLRELKTAQGFGRGLSAPQIGAPVRIVYIEMDKPWVLINPEIIDVGNEDFSVWDDCFSIPDLLVRVSRAYRVRLRYQDVKGEHHTADLEGEVAELVQHEVDHLDGVLIVDRPHGLDPFCLRKEWNRRYARAGRYGAPEPRTATYATALSSLL
ncbi:MAG TPA: peptide deformylase [Gemmatimonadales bacterium]|nr:peptide deformylase [Gemmatimonadales bacterium]